MSPITVPMSWRACARWERTSDWLVIESTNGRQSSADSFSGPTQTSKERHIWAAIKPVIERTRNGVGAPRLTINHTALAPLVSPPNLVDGSPSSPDRTSLFAFTLPARFTFGRQAYRPYVFSQRAVYTDTTGVPFDGGMHLPIPCHWQSRVSGRRRGRVPWWGDDPPL